MTSDIHQLMLEPLAESEWRLADHAVARDHPESVIAHIERRRDGWYHVTWIAHGVGSGIYASLRDVLAEASRLVAAAHRAPARKPQPIPHRPPPARS